MRKTKVFLIVLTLLILLPAIVACPGGSAGTPQVSTESEKRSDELARSIDPNLIDANTRFAFELLQELISEDRGKNVFFSPLHPAGPGHAQVQDRIRCEAPQQRAFQNGHGCGFHLPR